MGLALSDVKLGIITVAISAGSSKIMKIGGIRLTP
jgi:hypothetical protein